MPPKDDNASPGLLRELRTLTVSTYQVSKGFGPLLRLLGAAPDITRDELSSAVDRACVGL